MTQLLRFFHMAVQSAGYDLNGEPSRLEVAGARLYFMVAGCQSVDLYESRVRAAIDAVKTLSHKNDPVTVIFSSANPGSAGSGLTTRERHPIVLDEAAEMMALFNEYRYADPDFPKDIALNLDDEGSSTKTSENINLFFRKIKLQEGNNNHVVVVSSLFHLPRLCDELNASLQASPQAISKITVVGAENPKTRNDAKRNPNYFKSAFFEAFDLIVARSNIAEMFEMRN